MVRVIAAHVLRVEAEAEDDGRGEVEVETWWSGWPADVDWCASGCAAPNTQAGAAGSLCAMVDARQSAS